MSKKKWILMILVIIILLFSLMRILNRDQISETIAQHHIMEVETGELQQTISASGNIYPASDRQHFFNQGGRIEEIYIEEGQHVETGEQLLKLNSHQQRLNLLRAQKAYSEAQIEGTETEKKSRRIELEMAEQELEDRILKAEISGQIIDFELSTGDYVTANNPVLSIIDEQSYQVKVNINEADSGLIKEGQEALIDIKALSGKDLSGEILKIDKRAQTDGGLVMVPVTIDIETTESFLRPGYSADVEIVVDSVQDKVIIPVTAVYEKDDSQYAVLIRNGNSPEPTEIITGLSDGLEIEVIEGLNKGDKILINTYQYADLIDDHIRLEFGPPDNQGGGRS